MEALNYHAISLSLSLLTVVACSEDACSGSSTIVSQPGVSACKLSMQQLALIASDGLPLDMSRGLPSGWPQDLSENNYRNTSAVHHDNVLVSGRTNPSTCSNSCVILRSPVSKSRSRLHTTTPPTSGRSVVSCKAKGLQEKGTWSLP
jgi:hypothetical protein